MYGAACRERWKEKISFRQMARCAVPFSMARPIGAGCASGMRLLQNFSRRNVFRGPEKISGGYCKVKTGVLSLHPLRETSEATTLKNQEETAAEKRA